MRMRVPRGVECADYGVCGTGTYQSSARNGFFWWELDVTYYALKALSWGGVVWDLRVPPAWVLAGAEGPPKVGPVAVLAAVLPVADAPPAAV